MKINSIGARIPLVALSQIILAGLFSYSAASKIVEYDDYYHDLAGSPLLQEREVPTVSRVLIIAELATVVMVALEQTKKFGFLFAFFLSALFLFYLSAVATVSPGASCGCGGILGRLGFVPHIVINLAVASFATIGMLKSGSATSI